MSTSQIKLKTSSVLHLPLQAYLEDFSFFVNGEEFKTNRLISDLLSPNISKIHLTDPTFNQITINTQTQGNFSYFLQLVNFDINDIPNDELPFISEIIEILSNDDIEILDESNYNDVITKDNIFSLIKRHEKSRIYKQRYQKEIEFISSNFYEFSDIYEEELMELSEKTLFNIIKNDQLRLKDEDQLVQFVNKLYLTNNSFNYFYNEIIFTNISSTTMKEFISIYDESDITKETWRSLSNRLINENCIELNENRYKFVKIPKNNEDFCGILNYLKKTSSGQIDNEVNITSSTVYEDLYPSNVILFDDSEKIFETDDEPNGWISFEFKNYSIIPTEYTVKSVKQSTYNFPKSWVIECSNDNKNWEIVDEKIDCASLKGENFVHTFAINNKQNKKFKLIRMRYTGRNWDDQNYIKLDSFELYGFLV